jgi:hypothetical protein
MHQFDKVRAVFEPKRVDNLKPGAELWIGREGIFRASWLIEADEDYGGQWAMSVPRDWWDWSEPYPGSWVPECDLRIIEIVSSVTPSADAPPSRPDRSGPPTR